VTEREQVACAVTVVGAGGRSDLLCPAAATVAGLARAYADLTGQATAPLLYTRDGVPLGASVTLTDAGVVTGSVLVATSGVVRRPRPPTEVPPLAVGGGGRRRGRRRRDVVSTRDGTGQGDPVDSSGPGG
jgi:hypothetical protein